MNDKYNLINLLYQVTRQTNSWTIFNCISGTVEVHLTRVLFSGYILKELFLGNETVEVHLTHVLFSEFATIQEVENYLLKNYDFV